MEWVGSTITYQIPTARGLANLAHKFELAKMGAPMGSFIDGTTGTSISGASLLNTTTHCGSVHLPALKH